MSQVYRPVAATNKADYLKPSPQALSFTDNFSGSSLDPVWTAQQPGKVTVSGGACNITFSTNGFFDNQVYKADRFIDCKVALTVAAGATITASHGPMARRQSTGACYITNVSLGGAMNTYTINSTGTPTLISAVSVAGVNFANGYIVSLETIGIAPTMVITTLTDLNGNHLATAEIADSAAQLQIPGQVGFAAWSQGALQLDAVNLYTRNPNTNVPTRVVLGAIGDSITAGVGTSGGANTVPSQCATKLNALTLLPVTVNNQGISSKTSADWLPAGTILGPALSSFVSGGVNIVSIMLGTNDAKESVKTPLNTYLANMSAIANACLANPGVTTVFIHSIPYHGVNGTDFNGSSLARVVAYNDNLPSICNGTNIIFGDAGAYGYFAQVPSNLADGIHPNDTGALVLGSYHARAIKRGLNL